MFLCHYKDFFTLVFFHLVCTVNEGVFDRVASGWRKQNLLYQNTKVLTTPETRRPKPLAQSRDNNISSESKKFQWHRLLANGHGTNLLQISLGFTIFRFLSASCLRSSLFFFVKNNRLFYFLKVEGRRFNSIDSVF